MTLSGRKTTSAADRRAGPRAHGRSGGAARWLLLACAAGPAGCADDDDAAAADAGAAATASAEPSSSPSAEPTAESAPSPPQPRHLLGIRGFATTVYAKPSTSASRLGYLRVGAIVERSAEPAGRRGCKGGWYGVQPTGFVCAGREATVDLDDPLLRASRQRPDLSKPLPYRYGFVRAVLPLYLRVPTAAQQYKAEFKLAEHLEWFKDNKSTVQNAVLGADDVAIDHRGVALRGKGLGELGAAKNSTELSLGELFGGQGDDDPPPFWLRNGQRLIPNISEFAVPDYALFADRARRHTGLAFIDSFGTGVEALRRRFAVTTDLRIAPTTKIKPDSASAWHGVELGGDLELPLAFVSRRGAQAYRVKGDEATAVGAMEHRRAHRLSGKQARADGEKYVQLADGRWLKREQAGLAIKPRKLPKVGRRGEKWIEIDLSEQTLVLWEGDKPVYATLVSTGRPAIGDWKKTTSSPRGVFRIFSKHVSATMDSDEGSGRRLNEEKELKPGDEGYTPNRGDGIYGVTKRRGEGLFKLRDVPHIQYFEANYAIHGSYWHDVFGIPRSHGCINLAPVDSHRLFLWTDPPVPARWHGVRSDKGTAVIIHK